jgi:hypothetical protein
MPVPLLSHRGAAPSGLARPLLPASRGPLPRPREARSLLRRRAPSAPQHRLHAGRPRATTSCYHVAATACRHRLTPPYITRGLKTSSFSRIVCVSPATASSIQPLRPLRPSRNSTSRAPAPRGPARPRPRARSQLPMFAGPRPHTSSARLRAPAGLRLSSALVMTHGRLTLMLPCSERISVIADPYLCRLASPPEKAGRMSQPCRWKPQVIDPAGSPAARSCPLVREVTIIGAATAVTGDAGTPGRGPCGLVSHDSQLHERGIHAFYLVRTVSE